MKTTKKIIAVVGLIIGVVVSNNTEANSTEIYIGAVMVLMAVMLLIPASKKEEAWVPAQ